MTIRSRLLTLLLPTLTTSVVLIALFFYFNWSDEIVNSFKLRLQSIGIATAQSIQPEEIEWLNQHLQDSDLSNNDVYKHYKQKLAQLKQKLPIINLSIVRIEPVREGEYVLPNDIKDPSNKIYEGHDPENGYRQVFLLEGSDQSGESGAFDFSETKEYQVYLTKKAFVTPIYEARRTHKRLMSTYAPIINNQGEVTALLRADMGVDVIDRKLKNALLIIALGASITILMVTGTVFLIADRISKPVQQLNQAALDISSGNYEANIQVKGPREIVELANTLNTMSECLADHISRLKESSLIRERMYGEYECALLLQHYMFQKVIEDFKSPYFLIRSISLNQATSQKGILVKLNENTQADLMLTLLEAKDQGFAALYELSTLAYRPLEELKDYSFIACQFLDHSLLRYQIQNLWPPLVWSIRSQKFVSGKNQEISLQDQDMIFLYNSGLIEQFGSQDKIEAWLGKVLRHFAEDGLDTIHTMLMNELTFLTKRDPIKRSFHILGLQIRHPRGFLLE